MLCMYPIVLSCPCLCLSSGCGGWQHCWYPPELVFFRVAILCCIIVDFSTAEVLLVGPLMPCCRETICTDVEMCWVISMCIALACIIILWSTGFGAWFGCGWPPCVFVSCLLTCVCSWGGLEGFGGMLLYSLFHTRALRNSTFLASTPQSARPFSSCWSQTAGKPPLIPNHRWLHLPSVH